MTDKKIPKWLLDGVQGLGEMTQRCLIDMSFRLQNFKNPRAAFEGFLNAIKTDGEIVKITNERDQNGRITSRIYHNAERAYFEAKVGRSDFESLPEEPLATEDYDVYTGELLPKAS